MLRINHIQHPLKGCITLEGSKSISNRSLIIQALCAEKFEIHGLAKAEDTKLLADSLSSMKSVYDVHHAGTSSRFLASYLTLQKGEQILTGSDQLKTRPIKPLIEALCSLGASIEYIEKEGHLPIKVGESRWQENGSVEIAGNISSQFISSLLLIAPYLPDGLKVKITGELVSRPYVEMTLKCMEYFGITYEWKEDIIQIEKQDYQAKNFTVEADWSAASYYYSLVGALPGSELQLQGLHQESTQGDSAISRIMNDIGVESSWQHNVLTLKHIPVNKSVFEYDFILCPDLAQSVVSYCSVKGITGLFTGLKTLKIKETDRIAALQTELAKIHSYFNKIPQKFNKKSQNEAYLLEGNPVLNEDIVFDTYHDHRMAMSLSVIASLGNININDPDVIKKSYPGYWKDLESLGIELTRC